MIKARLLIVLSCVLLESLGAQNAQTLYPADDPIFQYLQDLNLEQNLGLPFSSGPFTKAEILAGLGRLNRDRLSEAGIRALREIEERTADRILLRLGDEYTADIETIVSWEGYAGSGDENRSWVYGFRDRKAVADFVFRNWLFENFYVTFDFGYQKDPFAVLDEKTTTMNLFWDPSAMDFAFPYRGGLVLGADHWNLQFLRFPLSWGWGHTGNLTISDAAMTHDYISFATFWDRFKFTTLVIGQDNYQVDTTQTVFGYHPTLENKPGSGIIKDGVDRLKLIVAHRLEFRPFESFDFTFTEMTAFDSRVFDFRYLNPFVSYHNWFLSENSNTDIVFEGDWTPFPFVNLYGQFYMDYIKTFLKDQRYNDPTPASYGRIFGLTTRFPAGPGYLRGGFEWAQTDPFMYLNDHVPMTVNRRYLTNYKGGYRLLVDSPLGYALGPDAVVYSLRAGYEVAGRWKAATEIRYAQKGQNTIRTPYATGNAANDLVTPSGVVKETLLWQISGGFQGSFVGLPEAFSVEAEIDVLGTPVFDLQAVLSLSYHF